MYPKNQNRSNFHTNFEETAHEKQKKTDSKLCQGCHRNPEEVIRSINRKTRRRRLFAGLYTVFQHDEEGKMFVKLCRRCFLIHKKIGSLRPALPPGAARRKRRKISSI
ncbi:MAG: hypothetical protein L0209_05835 [candidate division Zixibacteria bacterium]|nr:hypothetical protein [candidate division Zixibacteria bacterium]